MSYGSGGYGSGGYGTDDDVSPAVSAIISGTAGGRMLPFSGEGGGGPDWASSLMGAYGRRKPAAGSRAAYVAALNQGIGPLHSLKY